MRMKSVLWLTLLACFTGVAGCSGSIIWGNILILALSAGIFLGTLNIERVRKDSETTSDISSKGEPS